jgi:hypothetical protein
VRQEDVVRIRKKVTELESTAPMYILSRDEFFDIRDLVYHLNNELSRKAYEGTDKTNPIIERLSNEIDSLKAQLDEKNKKEY